MTQSRPISTWQELQVLYEALKAESPRKWIYRGQRDNQWDITSKLERAAQRFGKPLERLPAIERWLLDEFKRHAHRYISNLPGDQDTLRWLALMQHHGAPTRLIDFTYSFHVAVYFAVENACPGEHCALWAIYQNWCWEQAKRQLPSELVQLIESDSTRGKTFTIQTKLLDSSVCTVIPDNPFRLDERLAVQ